MQAVGSRLRAAPPTVCVKCGEKRVELRRLRALLARAEARVGELEAAAAAAAAAALPPPPPAPPAAATTPVATGSPALHAVAADFGTPLALVATPVAWSGASSGGICGAETEAAAARGGGGSGSPGLAAPRCLFLGSPLAPARERLSAASSVAHEDEDGCGGGGCGGGAADSDADADSAAGCGASSDVEVAAAPVASVGSGAGAVSAPHPAPLVRSAEASARLSSVAPGVRRPQLPPLSLVAKPASEWSADVRLCQATGCGAEFGLLVWRHHCRLCGGAFCARCSARELQLQPAAALPTVAWQPAATSARAPADAGDAPPQRRGGGVAARRGYSEAPLAAAAAPAAPVAAGPPATSRVCEGCYVACREQLRARRRAQRAAAAVAVAPATLAVLAGNAIAAAPRGGKPLAAAASGGGASRPLASSAR